jgi:transcriptional regulator with XRE-family HTH domain
MWMKDIRALFAANLKTIRTQAKLSQEAIAEATGLSVRMIREIESGNRAPSFDSLANLCSALKVDAYQFFLPTEGVTSFDRRNVLTKLKEDLLKDLNRRIEQYLK